MPRQASPGQDHRHQDTTDHRTGTVDHDSGCCVASPMLPSTSAGTCHGAAAAATTLYGREIAGPHIEICNTASPSSTEARILRPLVRGDGLLRREPMHPR